MIDRFSMFGFEYRLEATLDGDKATLYPSVYTPFFFKRLKAKEFRFSRSRHSYKYFNAGFATVSVPAKQGKEFEYGNWQGDTGVFKKSVNAKLNSLIKEYCKHDDYD